MVDVARSASGMQTLETLSPEVLSCTASRHAFNAQQHSHLTPVPLQEITRSEKHLKDPKFVELLADYAKEIANPEVILGHIQPDLRQTCASAVRQVFCPQL